MHQPVAESVTYTRSHTRREVVLHVEFIHFLVLPQKSIEQLGKYIRAGTGTVRRCLIRKNRGRGQEGGAKKIILRQCKRARNPEIIEAECVGDMELLSHPESCTALHCRRN